MWAVTRVAVVVMVGEAPLDPQVSVGRIRVGAFGQRLNSWEQEASRREARWMRGGCACGGPPQPGAGSTSTWPWSGWRAGTSRVEEPDGQPVAVWVRTSDDRPAWAVGVDMTTLYNLYHELRLVPIEGSPTLPVLFAVTPCGQGMGGGVDVGGCSFQRLIDD
jgi:hypothetical protein